MTQQEGLRNQEVKDCPRHIRTQITVLDQWVRNVVGATRDTDSTDNQTTEMEHSGRQTTTAHEAGVVRREYLENFTEHARLGKGSGMPHVEGGQGKLSIPMHDDSAAQPAHHHKSTLHPPNTDKRGANVRATMSDDAQSGSGDAMADKREQSGADGVRKEVVEDRNRKGVANDRRQRTEDRGSRVDRRVWRSHHRDGHRRHQDSGRNGGVARSQRSSRGSHTSRPQLGTKAHQSHGNAAGKGQRFGRSNREGRERHRDKRQKMDPNRGNNLCKFSNKGGYDNRKCCTIWRSQSSTISRVRDACRFTSYQCNKGAFG